MCVIVYVYVHGIVFFSFFKQMKITVLGLSGDVQHATLRQVFLALSLSPLLSLCGPVH